MNLGMKLNITGWVIFSVSFMLPTPHHESVVGVSIGLFIASIWASLSKTK